MVVPLCGGLLTAHACPMEIARQGHEGGCQGPAGPGLKRQAMDCCVAPQSGSAPATVTTAVAPAIALPTLQPLISAVASIASIAPAHPPVAPLCAPGLVSLHSSLLL